MQRHVLLGRGPPHEERIDVERDVLVKKWNSEVGILLRQRHAVIICKARTNKQERVPDGVGPDATTVAVKSLPSLYAPQRYRPKPAAARPVAAHPSAMVRPAR